MVFIDRSIDINTLPIQNYENETKKTEQLFLIDAIHFGNEMDYERAIVHRYNRKVNMKEKQEILF